jgi:hypothetical protein
METVANRIATRYLRVIAQEEQQQEQEGQQAPSEDEAPNYGGKGPFELPPDHVAAIQVPKGGACCAKCKFVDVANHACLEPNYVNWNGGDSALPDLPLDEICSDWFAAGAAEGAPAEGQQQT